MYRINANMRLYQLVIACSFIGVTVLLYLVAWYKRWTRVGMAAGGLAIVGLMLVTLVTQVDPRTRLAISRGVGNKLLLHASGSVFTWEPTRHKSAEEYANYWNPGMNPEVQDKLRTRLPKPGRPKNIAVVHFRCSDVPFTKHASYCLLPIDYFRFVATEILARHVDKITIVTCAAHNRHELADKCTIYTNTIQKWLSDFTGLRVDIDYTCMSIEDTMQLFIDAKVLVSTGGSFSFCPGVLKGKNFITPSLMGTLSEEHGNDIRFRDLHRLVSWEMWKEFGHIPHSVDYSTFDYQLTSNRFCDPAFL